MNLGSRILLFCVFFGVIILSFFIEVPTFIHNFFYGFMALIGIGSLFLNKSNNGLNKIFEKKFKNNDE